MKFYGEPNQLVNTRKYNHRSGKVEQKTLFCFDKNGEYETDNQDIIEKLKTHFKHDENVFKCSKCGFETDSKGKLLAHYRSEHPKEVEND
jgi:hypothetical protein